MTYIRQFHLVAMLLLLHACNGSSKTESAPVGETATPAPQARVPTVAIYNLMSHPILDASAAGIKRGLAEHGYSAPRIKFVETNANGEMDKLNAFAKELLSVRPDVIVPISTPVTQAVAKEAPPSQAIVFSTVTNPADVGMDKKPANMTGVSDAVNYAANLDLIKELYPKARVVGMIYNAGERNSQFGVNRVKELVGSRDITLDIAAISKSSEVADAARGMLDKVDAFYVGSDNTVVAALDGLLKVAYGRKVPVFASDVGSVEKGAVAAISVDYEKLGLSAGAIVAQVLKSQTEPGTIPNMVFEGDSLILNAKSAASLGLTLDVTVRQRAARIIE